MRARLVAIAGGSGSGKTFLARRLKRRLGAQAGILSLDDFYRDLSHLPPQTRHRCNFDHPDAIEWPLFEECLKRIRRGLRTALPRYDFATHTRQARARWWLPRSIVLLDGLWLLSRPALRRLYALSIYVDSPDHLRLARRIDRDQRERRRSRASILRQFHQQVAPMHQRFVEPQRRWADLVLDPEISPQTISRLAAALKGRGKPRQLAPGSHLCPERSCGVSQIAIHSRREIFHADEARATSMPAVVCKERATKSA